MNSVSDSLGDGFKESGQMCALAAKDIEEHSEVLNMLVELGFEIVKPASNWFRKKIKQDVWQWQNATSTLYKLQNHGPWESHALFVYFYFAKKPFYIFCH